VSGRCIEQLYLKAFGKMINLAEFPGKLAVARVFTTVLEFCEPERSATLGRFSEGSLPVLISLRHSHCQLFDRGAGKLTLSSPD